jgi:glycine C-acetyltransferase/8-amino-7-oxononanoate synthase
VRACELALARGIFAQAIRPPTVPLGTSRLRLAVMASHTKSELREAARVLADAVYAVGVQTPDAEPAVDEAVEVFDAEAVPAAAPAPAAASAPKPALFDGEAERVAA